MGDEAVFDGDGGIGVAVVQGVFDAAGGKTDESRKLGDGDVDVVDAAGDAGGGVGSRESSDEVGKVDGLVDAGFAEPGAGEGVPSVGDVVYGVAVHFGLDGVARGGDVNIGALGAAYDVVNAA